MTRGGRICFFSSFRSNRLAACLSRRLCTNTSSTIPVWSTARQSQCFTPAILMATSSRCHLSPTRGSLRRIRSANAWPNLSAHCRTVSWLTTTPRAAIANRTLVEAVIPAMAEEAFGILSGDAVESGPERLFQSLDGAGCDTAQVGFQLRPAGLDRVQVWTVGGQIAIGEAGSLKHRLHLKRLVGAQIVHHQHGIGLALLQHRQQHRLEIGGKGGTVGGRVDAHRRHEAVHCDGAKHAQPLPLPERDAG